MRQRSKKLAWVATFLASGLSALAMFKGMPGPAAAIPSTVIPAAFALYASKQYNDRKHAELNNNNDGNTN